MACLQSAFAKQKDVVGTGDLTLPHRLILPLLGGSFAHPTPKVLDIERRESESLSLFQKLYFFGGGGVLSPGWRPFPRPRRQAEPPGRPFLPFLLWGTPGLGGPRPHLIGGPRLSPWSTGRPGYGDHYFKASSKTVLGQPKAGFYAWGRAPGTDGLKDQSGWGGRPPLGHAPRPAPDVGATSEVREGLEFRGRAPCQLCTQWANPVRRWIQPRDAPPCQGP